MKSLLNKLHSTIKKPQFQKNLIKLYGFSQREHSRNGKICMEIGMAREKDLVASLRHELGDCIDYQIDNKLTEDFKLNQLKFSVKHSQSSIRTPVKINWNVGLYKESIQEIIDAPSDHFPNLLLSYIDLKRKAVNIICIDSSTNEQVIKQLGFGAFRIPSGNARGIEYSRKATDQLLDNYYFKVSIPDADLTGGLDPIERRLLLLD